MEKGGKEHESSFSQSKLLATGANPYHFARTASTQKRIFCGLSWHPLRLSLRLIRPKPCGGFARETSGMTVVEPSNFELEP
jgi:hypothetical protein